MSPFLVDLWYQFPVYLSQFFFYFTAFAVIISIIVFVHEYGHYQVAKWCGVKIEAFSIGFGPEIFGWTDKSGTRWKVCYVPMGGYVQMFGDDDPSSSKPSEKALKKMTKKQKDQAFHFKPLWQKALVVAAGPAANFLFAIAILTGFIMVYGKPSTEPVVSAVMEESAAADAGLLPGDVILRIDNSTVEDFGDIQQVVGLNTGTPLAVTFRRDGDELTVDVTPRLTESEDFLGNKVTRALLGIQASSHGFTQEKVILPVAIWLATKETYNLTAMNLQALGQIIVGDRSIKDLGGPVKIAQYSGQATKKGLYTMLWLMVAINIGLGLINLFPIPVLDGGHLLYYLIESIQGRPLAEKYQEYSMKAGFAFIIILAVVITYNDVVGLFAR